MTFGSAGNGSAQHLALELFKLQAKVDAIHVPYKGSGPLLTDLMGGQIQYSFETMTAATPHVKSGKVLAVAQTRTKRAKGPPQRADHGGAGLPRLRGHHRYGLVGPGKLPTAIAQKMNGTSTRYSPCPTCRRSSTPTAPRTAAARAKFAAFIRSRPPSGPGW